MEAPSFVEDHVLQIIQHQPSLRRLDVAMSLGHSIIMVMEVEEGGGIYIPPEVYIYYFFPFGKGGRELCFTSLKGVIMLTYALLYFGAHALPIARHFSGGGVEIGGILLKTDGVIESTQMTAISETIVRNVSLHHPPPPKITT